MRFIVFYNDHPKVKDYDVRVWDNRMQHPNIKGEITHPQFIKQYHFNPKHISSVGCVIFNPETQKWILDPKSPVVFFGNDEKRRLLDRMLILTYMQSHFSQDKEAQQQSLREQEAIRRHHIWTHLNKKKYLD